MFESNHSPAEVYCVLLFAFEKGKVMQPRLVQNYLLASLSQVLGFSARATISSSKAGALDLPLSSEQAAVL